MKRFAQETSIHGLREAVNSNGLGRIFWAILFTFCITGMVFQLKNLIAAYINDEVATEVHPTRKAEYIDVPSLFACPEQWLRTGDHESKNFWRRLIYNNLVDYMIRPTDPEMIDRKRASRGTIDFIDSYLRKGSVMDGSDAMDSNSRIAVVQSVFDELRSDLEQVDWKISKLIDNLFAKGQFAFEFVEPFNASVKIGFGSSYTNITKHPAITLDGVCLEMRPKLEGGHAQDIVDNAYRFIVHYFGGYELPINMQKNSTQNASLMIRDPKVLEYFGNNPQESRVAVSRQGRPSGAQGLNFLGIVSFGNVLPVAKYIDFFHVLIIKFWTKKAIKLNREAYKCRDWEFRDQSHCLQHQTTSKRNCDLYLPQSLNFEETPAKNICIHDHGGWLHKINIKLGLNISNQVFHDVVQEMKRTSPVCPPPCESLEFEFEARFLKIRSEIHDYCSSMEDRVYKTNGLRKASTDLKKIPGETACFIVEFRQFEDHGMIFKEYPRVSPEDLTSNVGGTLGLWLGASIISFVQAIHIACLNKIFKRGSTTTTSLN